MSEARHLAANRMQSGLKPCGRRHHMVIPDNHRPSLPPAVAGSDYLLRSRAGTDRNNDRKSKDLITSRSKVDLALARTRDGSRAGRAEIRLSLRRCFSLAASMPHL